MSVDVLVVVSGLQLGLEVVLCVGCCFVSCVMSCAWLLWLSMLLCVEFACACFGEFV